MHVVCVPNEPPETYIKSLFLAGPSPRDADQPNWRPEALRLLEELGYDGVVFVPLTESGDWCGDKETQYAWEQKYLDAADQIVFWVPRDMTTLPGLTTNVEFGMYYNSGRVVLGAPESAVHMDYLRQHARKELAPVHTALFDALKQAMQTIGEGAVRTNGERDVPLNIWRAPHFQSWYQAQVAAGNRLDGARPLWTCRVGPTKNFLFAYALAVNVYIASEGRNKINEFIISRPNVSTIVAYRTDAELCWGEPTLRELLDTEIVIVREFRSPASVGDCMVREVPGGSSWKPGENPFDVAAHELAEETGLTVEPRRLRLVGTRQIGATLATHCANVFSCTLTYEEMRALKAVAASGQAHGVEADSERTYVEIRTVRELLLQPITDWANLGMIFRAIVYGTRNF